jgi:hypothetical protein
MVVPLWREGEMVYALDGRGLWFCQIEDDRRVCALWVANTGKAVTPILKHTGEVRYAIQFLPATFLPTFASNGQIYAFSEILGFRAICITISGL